MSPDMPELGGRLTPLTVAEMRRLGLRESDPGSGGGWWCTASWHYPVARDIYGDCCDCGEPCIWVVAS